MAVLVSTPEIVFTKSNSTKVCYTMDVIGGERAIRSSSVSIETVSN